MDRTAGNLMTPKERCAIVALNDTIAIVKERMCEHQHRMAIVVDDNDNRVVGVITVSNLEMVDDDDLVSPYCSKPAYTILPETPIGRARQELFRISVKADKRIHQLVVVNANSEPLGILWDYVAILGCSGEQEKKT